MKVEVRSMMFKNNWANPRTLLAQQQPQGTTATLIRNPGSRIGSCQIYDHSSLSPPLPRRNSRTVEYLTRTASSLIVDIVHAIYRVTLYRTLTSVSLTH